MTRCVVLVGDSVPGAEPHELYRLRVAARLSLDEAARHAGLDPYDLGAMEHRRAAFPEVVETKLRALYETKCACGNQGVCTTPWDCKMRYLVLAALLLVGCNQSRPTDHPFSIYISQECFVQAILAPKHFIATYHARYDAGVARYPADRYPDVENDKLGEGMADCEDAMIRKYGPDWNGETPAPVRTPLVQDPRLGCPPSVGLCAFPPEWYVQVEVDRQHAIMDSERPRPNSSCEPYSTVEEWNSNRVVLKSRLCYVKPSNP